MGTLEPMARPCSTSVLSSRPATQGLGGGCPGCPRGLQTALERARLQAPPCRAIRPLASLQTPTPAMPAGLLTRALPLRPQLRPRYPTPAAHHLLTRRSASVSHGICLIPPRCNQSTGLPSPSPPASDTHPPQASKPQQGREEPL